MILVCVFYIKFKERFFTVSIEVFFHNIAVEIKIGVEAEDAHKLSRFGIFGCGFSNGVLIVVPINGLNTHNCTAFTVFYYLRYFYTAKLHTLFELTKFSCVIFTQILIFNILSQNNEADNR